MNRVAFWSQLVRAPWNLVAPLLAVATLSGSALALGPSESAIALNSGTGGSNAPTTGSSPNQAAPLADLKVTISASIIRRDSPYRGQVRIYAHAQNVGNKTFNSGDHEVRLTLVETIPGGAAPRVLRSVRIPKLKDGQFVTLIYSMDWNTSTEFPPSYKAYLSYDPGYTLPEANPSNNQETYEGARINRLFGH